MVEKQNVMKISSSSPFALSEGYTSVSYKPKSKAKVTMSFTNQSQTESVENPYVPFIEGVVKEVSNLPYKRRKIFSNTLTKVAVMITSLYGLTSLVTEERAKAGGLDELLPYLQQRATNKVPTYQEPTQEYPSEGMIPVDGSVIKQIKEIGILPVEIVDLLVDIILACGIIGLLLAMLCLIIAGGFRMVGQLERAKKWSVDIIKGFGQILLAPVIILLLALITNLVLGGIGGLDLFY